MSKLRVLSVSVGFASWLFGAAAHAQCNKDVACAADLVCEEGQCVTPTTTTAAAAPVVATDSASPSVPAGDARRSATIGTPRVIFVHGPSTVQPPSYERRSPELILVGSLAVAGGVGGLLVGLGSMGNTCHHELSDGFSVEHCVRSPDYLAYGLGGSALLGGALLILIGAKKVPVEPSAQAYPWLAPGAGGLALRIKL